MTLGQFEQLVLLAVLHLEHKAYGVEIAAAIEERSGRSVSRSALYVTFDRLEAKGLLESHLQNATPERGGKLRRYVTVTPLGLQQLRESRTALMGMWQGLESILGEEA